MRWVSGIGQLAKFTRKKASRAGEEAESGPGHPLKVAVERANVMILGELTD